ncbi:Condensin complex subunit [Gaertneriomyces sp. JEL0708]|nr:Condensin complex subunit [Gaertneriomyces sp. JEL0708]
MAESFVLHDELVCLQEGRVQIENEIPIARLTPSDVNNKLDDLIEILKGDSSQILNIEVFDGLRSFIRHFDILPLETCHKLVDILLSVFCDQTKSVEADLEENAQHNFEQDKTSLQSYAFCWHWLMTVAETRWKSIKREVEKAATLAGKPKARTAKAKKESGNAWDWPSQRVAALKAAISLLQLDLGRIIIASSDISTIINMVTKSAAFLLEDAEIVKDDETKDDITEILCICMKNYEAGAAYGIEARVLGEFLREEHLADFVAEFMYRLATRFEDTRLTENVLRKSQGQEFSDKDLKPAKSFARFLVRASELLPKEVLKQMVHLQVHLDSDSYTIRMGMIEVIGNLIHMLLASDNSESAGKSLEAYYEIFQDRLRDVSSYVRVKVLQVLMKLTERHPDTGLTDIPIATRPALINLVAGRLQDKASNVRKNAIKLLARFIETSPFMAIAQDEGKLSLKHFEEKKRNLEEIIKMKFPTEELPGVAETDNSEKNEDSMDVDEPESQQKLRPVEAGASEQELRNLRGLLKYYKDGIKFIRQIEAVVPTMCELLASNAKGEVIEAMNFLVVAHKFQMECAAIGIRKMVHKIWDKDTGETERLSVRDHLMRCYIAVYFESDNAEVIAENLINLTHTMTLAELTSFEQLLSTLVAADVVTQSVLDVLWGVFGSKKHHPRRRRGAIMILGMIGKARKEAIADNLEMLLRVGFGEYAKKDLLLARYACVALQQLGTVKRQKGSLAYSYSRLPANHPIFMRLSELIVDPTAKSLDWFGFAEQAINAIYLLSEHPDLTCASMIKTITSRIFGVSRPDDAAVDQLTAQLSQTLQINSETTQGAPVDSHEQNLGICDPLELSKLCFVLGHVAVKQIVHLEAVEAEWKRRKHAEEAAKTPRRAGSQDELDQVTGTAEDEFAEAIAHIREQELLFGDNSLLTAYGPLLSYICLNNRTFDHPILQIMSVLALCKFMCVSADFCDAHLQLLFTILEKSQDPVIRSNTIIALGDMTVSFNSLIDQNISYLYNRLNDADLTVKKNTLMVLTFLILNGMVKVKGQISEMAKCLEDEDQRISDLTKLFFTELSTKDNAVYNNLPDIISNLSHPETGVNEESFKNIMKFLLDFIKKDKQTENIVDKLCMRFCNADTTRQWRDIAYCLSLLSFASEKSVRKFFEHLPHYQDKLHEPTVYKLLQDLLSKAKKTAKADLKSSIEDFEGKLQELHDKCVENDQAASKATQEHLRRTGKVKRESGIHGATEKSRRLNTSARLGSAPDADEADVADLIAAPATPGVTQRALGRSSTFSARKQTSYSNRPMRNQTPDSSDDNEGSETAVEDEEDEDDIISAKPPLPRRHQTAAVPEESEDDQSDSDSGHRDRHTLKRAKHAFRVNAPAKSDEDDEDTADGAESSEEDDAFETILPRRRRQSGVMRASVATPKRASKTTVQTRTRPRATRTRRTTDEDELLA